MAAGPIVRRSIFDAETTPAELVVEVMSSELLF